MLLVWLMAIVGFLLIATGLVFLFVNSLSTVVGEILLAVGLVLIFGTILIYIMNKRPSIYYQGKTFTNPMEYNRYLNRGSTIHIPGKGPNYEGTLEYTNGGQYYGVNRMGNYKYNLY